MHFPFGHWQPLTWVGPVEHLNHKSGFELQVTQPSLMESLHRTLGSQCRTQRATTVGKRPPDEIRFELTFSPLFALDLVLRISPSKERQAKVPLKEFPFKAVLNPQLALFSQTKLSAFSTREETNKNVLTTPEEESTRRRYRGVEKRRTSKT